MGQTLTATLRDIVQREMGHTRTEGRALCDATGNESPEHSDPGTEGRMGGAGAGGGDRESQVNGGRALLPEDEKV